MKDFYYILGLQPNCTLDEIKEAYRKLSKKLHPDLNQGDAYFENRFKDVNEAFETLRDPGKRARFDEQLSSDHRSRRPHQSRHRTRYASPPDFTRYKRRGPGLGMTIALVVIALIAGDYLIHWFSKPKPAPLKTALVVSPAPGRTHHIHRKKHSLKNKISGYYSKSKPDTSSKKPPVPAKTARVAEPKTAASAEAGLPFTSARPNAGKSAAPPKPAVAANILKLAPVAVQSAPKKAANTVNSNNFPCAAYVRPNATGIIYLRRSDSYNSAVIEKIPADSKVFVLEKGETYDKVTFGNTIGYVPKWALQVK